MDETMRGTRLGRFRLKNEIARGGMGVVWLAEEEGTKRRVVVKELLPCLRGDATMQAMFVDEARLASRLAHANIVRTLDVGTSGERPYMALELLEGATLARVIASLGAQKTSLPLALGVRVLAAVLAALHHAHELRDERGLPLGVVHRDVSPNNVFLTSDGRVKLLDFGVAKSRGRATETRSGVLKGSVAYMSPDHVCGATIDRRADVFAVGVLLRELVTGERLWAHDATELGILKRLVAREIPVFAPRLGVPEELRAICKKAMAGQRSERFATADAMREALVRWLDENDVGGSLGELVPVLERVARDEAKRVAREREAFAPTVSADAVEIGSSALVSVSDLRTPIGRDLARTKKTKRAGRQWSGWLTALALAAGIVGVGVSGLGPNDVAGAFASLGEAPQAARELPASNARSPVARGLVTPTPVIDVTPITTAPSALLFVADAGPAEEPAEAPSASAADALSETPSEDDSTAAK